MNRSSKYYNVLATWAGTVAAVFGPGFAVQTLPVTRPFARYWSRKLVDPTFHPGEVGGARNMKFDDLDQEAAEALLFVAVKREPRKGLENFATSLSDQGYPVDKQYALQCAAQIA